MSFREKTAWVTLIAILAVTLLYWLHVPNFIEPRHGMWVLHAMLASLLTYLVIELVAWIVLRKRNPRDARMPVDERERLIDLKAIRIAYYVFATGALGGVFVSLHLTRGGPTGVGMAVFMAFVLSQVVKHATRIVLFRRGA
jgi:amino acid transporter